VGKGDRQGRKKTCNKRERWNVLHLTQPDPKQRKQPTLLYPLESSEEACKAGHPIIPILYYLTTLHLQGAQSIRIPGTRAEF
jgi:hypothetical protein